jgi:acetyl-CoA carboxylase beta subunit
VEFATDCRHQEKGDHHQAPFQALHPCCPEFLLEHGFIDFIVNRKDMKEKLTQILKLISA